MYTPNPHTIILNYYCEIPKINRKQYQRPTRIKYATRTKSMMLRMGKISVSKHVPNKGKSLEAVSYTHLDVYKRQLCVVYVLLVLHWLCLGIHVLCLLHVWLNWIYIFLFFCMHLGVQNLSLIHI